MSLAQVPASKDAWRNTRRKSAILVGLDAKHPNERYIKSFFFYLLLCESRYRLYPLRSEHLNIVCAEEGAYNSPDPIHLRTHSISLRITQLAFWKDCGKLEVVNSRTSAASFAIVVICSFVSFIAVVLRAMKLASPTPSRTCPLTGGTALFGKRGTI